jgi:hypothetical protein
MVVRNSHKKRPSRFLSRVILYGLLAQIGFLLCCSVVYVLLFSDVDEHQSTNNGPSFVLARYKQQLRGMPSLTGLIQHSHKSSPHDDPTKQRNCVAFTVLDPSKIDELLVVVKDLSPLIVFTCLYLCKRIWRRSIWRTN